MPRPGMSRIIQDLLFPEMKHRKNIFVSEIKYFFIFSANFVSTNFRQGNRPALGHFGNLLYPYRTPPPPRLHRRGRLRHLCAENKYTLYLIPVTLYLLRYSFYLLPYTSHLTPWGGTPSDRGAKVSKPCHGLETLPRIGNLATVSRPWHAFETLARIRKTGQETCGPKP